MALHWSVTEVPNWKKKQEADDGTLNCIIWATISIGMDKLNAENAKEFLYRMNRFTNEVCSLGMPEGKTVIWTMEMLKPWFGLYTNAPPMSNAAFDEHLRILTRR